MEGFSIIYFLRHGLDDERFIGGHSDTQLTCVGIDQVIKSTHFMLTKNIKFSKIVSSDILRSVETALLVSDFFKKPIYYEEYLRELDKGLLTGMNKCEAMLRYPEFLNVNNIYTKYPNGESMVDFYNRIKRDLPKILNNDDSLIVTHRGVINMIYYILNDIDVDMNKERFGVTHASIHEYDSALKRIRKIY